MKMQERLNCLPFEFVHQPVPVRLHGLAVTSPGRQKLDEHALAGRLTVPILGGQLDGGSGWEQQGRAEENVAQPQHG